MLIWHPSIGGAQQTVTIGPKGQADLAVKVPAPTGRLYANQMVENPYVRFGITQDIQSQIIPALEKQKY